MYGYPFRDGSMDVGKTSIRLDDGEGSTIMAAYPYRDLSDRQKLRGRGTRVSPQIWNISEKYIVSRSRIPL